MLMNETSEAGCVLQPEQFIGDIVIGSQRMAVSLTASASASGRLALDVEPISVSGSSGSALELMRSISRPGNTINEFGLECESSDGKRLTSDRAYLAGYNHNSEGLHIQLRTAEAHLGMTGHETHDRPALCFSLLGFECYPPAHAVVELGSVVARGATRSAATNEITGTITVQASDKSASTDWRQQAERLLTHLGLVLGFARGAPLPVPITEFYEGDHVDVTFYEAGGGHPSEMPPLSHLNLGPIVTTAVAHVDVVDAYRETFETAIGWLLVPTKYDEVRFLTGMTALESLASRFLGKSQSSILGTSAFKRFAKQVIAFVDEQEYLEDTVRKAVKEKIPELNRRSFSYKIDAVFERWNISRTLIDDKVLARLVRLRNSIVHQGGASESEDLWSSILVVREILVRFVLAMLQFDGIYQCYIGGRHMRRFPSCEPVG